MRTTLSPRIGRNGADVGQREPPLTAGGGVTATTELGKSWQNFLSGEKIQQFSFGEHTLEGNSSLMKVRMYVCNVRSEHQERNGLF